MELVQKAVIRKNNSFLVLHRAGNAKYFPEYWDFPGGKLEPKEDPFAGIEREVLEETSIKIKALDVVGIYEFDVEKKGRNTHRFTLYSTEIISGNVRISSEHSAFRWATKEEILKLKTEPYIKKYFDSIKGSGERKKEK